MKQVLKNRTKNKDHSEIKRWHAEGNGLLPIVVTSIKTMQNRKS